MGTKFSISDITHILSKGNEIRGDSFQKQSHAMIMTLQSSFRLGIRVHRRHEALVWAQMLIMGSEALPLVRAGVWVPKHLERCQ